VSVARFIADQRTNYRVPHTITCALLGVSTSWFYKWLHHTPTPTEQRRGELDTAVADAFAAARGLHGSPRLHADLREAGWAVSEKTVADSMRRQGLIARRIRRRGGLTRQDKTAPKFPDLLKRDFTADRPNARWVGDMTEIRTGPDGRGPKLYLATVIDLYSRRLLGAATGLHSDAELACEAIKMAVAARSGAEQIQGVIFHTGRGSTVAVRYTQRLAEAGAVASVGSTGDSYDALAEAFNSRFKAEPVRNKGPWKGIDDLEIAVAEYVNWFNHRRLHGEIGLVPPAEHEDTFYRHNTAATTVAASVPSLH